jgi:glycosyltransferase involved in cell wall biosynthesis
VWIRHNPWKDWKTLRAAIQRVAERNPARKILVLVIGEQGEPEHFHSTEVQLRGFVSDPALVARYYQAADIFLHAARSDTFPNTVLEALACGIPTIGTRVGGIPEQIVHGETGFLVPPANAAAFVEHIEQLLNDPALRARMSAASIARARAHYDLDRQVTDYLNWYSEILDARGDV